MPNIYAVIDLKNLLNTIADGYNREQVIKEAEEHYEVETEVNLCTEDEAGEEAWETIIINEGKM